MILSIPTPSLPMSIGILVSWGVGCSCVAGNIYSRFFLTTNISSMAVQFWTRLFVVLLGILLFPSIHLFDVALLWILPNILIGALGGIAVVRFELWNECKLYEKINSDFKHKRKINIAEKDIGEIECFQLGLCEKPSKISDWKNRSISYIYQITNKSESYSLFYLVGTAVLEELIFRGYLLSLCYWLPSYYPYPMIILLVLFFGAKHSHARSREFLAKTFLGAVTTFETILLGNIISASITHGYLNYYVYQQRKNK